MSVARHGRGRIGTLRAVGGVFAKPKLLDGEGMTTVQEKQHAVYLHASTLYACAVARKNSSNALASVASIGRMCPSCQSAVAVDFL